MSPVGLGASRISEARLFLATLFAGKPDDLYLLLWMLPEKRSHWFQHVEDAIRFAESQHDHDLYVGTGLSKQDHGPHKRCLADEVAGTVGLWADLDLRSEAHATAALPATAEEALRILPSELPPTFLVRTGNGVHAWWLFKEPLIFESDQERRDTVNLVSRWQTLLRLSAAAQGWNFDRLSDLARVLRVPGTQNRKDPRNPKNVEIYYQTDRRYNAGDLEEFLDVQAVPDTEEQQRLSAAWKSKFAGKSLVINPSAAVPPELLDRFMAEDSRFQKTWLRTREDLKDASQSGYDLALANFGAKKGFSEQQMVDLIIHHRRIHGQQQRTRLDYFQRTIATAVNGTEESEVPSLATQQSGSEPDTPVGPDQPKPTTATERALLCEQISSTLGVRLLRILKITGKEPTYQLELESAKVELSSVNKLIDQRSFRTAIASAADYLIPKIKPKLWEQLVQAILRALTIEDGGEETELVGAARMFVEHYLAETPFIDCIEGKPIQMCRKPTQLEGRIAICSSDLQAYINKTFVANHSIKDVASMLTALGASSKRIRALGKNRQSRWLLPLSEFAPGDYAVVREENGNA